MKIKNPFKKKQTLGDKVAQTLHIQKRPSKKNKIVKLAMNLLLYISIFLAGYIFGKLQNLFNMV